MQSSNSIYQINRKYTVNSEYFDDIDTQEKAYWLGFLWADGNISKTAPRCSGPNRLRLSQKLSEKNHILKFLEHIGSNHKLVSSKSSYGAEVLHVDINSRPLCSALEKHGYGLKSERRNIPNIQKHLIRHFLRGYFDGDGAMSVYTQNVENRWTILKQEWSITGNIELLHEFKDLLNSQTTVSKNVKMKTYKDSPNTVSLRYGKHDDITSLYDYMYKDATVYLKSKHDKFMEHFSRTK